MTAPEHTADAGVPPGEARVRGFLPSAPRCSPLAAVLSLLLHLAVILLLVRVGLEQADLRGNPISDLLQQAGGGGGGGQGGTEYVMLAPPPPPPPEPEPEQVVVPVVTPQVVPPVEQTPDLKPVTQAPPDTMPAGGQSAGSGGGSGGGKGTGQGPGTGSGVGPGSGGGTGGGTGGGGRLGTPPENRTMILPPLDGVPKALRGTAIEVTFNIAATGVVTSVDHPPIADTKFQRKFDDMMMGYLFKPARDADGRAVAGVAVFTITFPER